MDQKINHINIASLLMKTGELYEDTNSQKICALTRALHILETHVNLEYATIADCLMSIAECHQKQNKDEKLCSVNVELFKYRTRFIPKNIHYFT
jgi:hypothetical protein